MVLPPNDEEVANSSKKTYPIQDYSAQTIPYFKPKPLKKHTLWRGTYLYSLPAPFPRGEKRVASFVIALDDSNDALGFSRF